MRKRTKFITLIAVVIMCMAAAIGVVGCKGKNGLTVSQSEASVPMNGTVTLTASVGGDAVPAEWSIDKDIATLTVIGNLCIVKPTAEGAATITASYDGKSATCALTVTPDNTETVVIEDGDTEVTEVSVEMGANKTLTAVASQGSAVTWSSSNDYVATVDQNGVVTGVLGGTCTVTAQVTASIKAEVTVTVTPPSGSDYYSLNFAEEDGSKIDSVSYSKAGERGKYFYWGGKYEEFGHAYQEVTVDYAYFQNNEVMVKYTCDTDSGRHDGFQVFYKHPDHELKKYYKLTCTIDIDVECDVTLNGKVFHLVAGENDLEVYYQYTSGMAGDKDTDKYGMSSFDLMMGVYNTSFVQNADFTVKNMVWVDDTETRVQLNAPTYTLASAGNDEDGYEYTITITDPNTEGTGGYLLKLYNSEELEVSTIPVENGKKVDLSYTENGTYTAKLIAVAENPHYIDSEPSETTEEIKVINPNGPTYEMTNNDETSCTAVPGRWTYWSSSWVQWTSKTYAMGKLTANFSNNSGNWDDTQLYYKNPADVAGKLYKMTLKIDAPNDGRVTAGGNVIKLKQGEHDYDFYYRAEDGKASFIIVFGVPGEANQQEITAGPVIIQIVSITEHTPEPLKAPTATVNNDSGKPVITIKDDQNDTGNCTYEVGFFSGDADDLVLEDKVAVEDGKEIDISSLLAGTYSMKIRAKSSSIGFEDSAWSAVIGTVTSTSTTIKIKNGEEHDAYIANKIWIEWHDHTDWNQSEVSVSQATYDTENGVVTLTYEIESGTNLYNNPMQLFWHDPDMTVGNGYKLNLKINASVAGTITINEQKVALNVGDNDVEITFEHIAEGTSWDGKTIGASLRIVFPDSGEGKLSGGTFTFSNIVIAEISDADKTQLVAPSFTLDADKKITITDTNTAGVGSYELGFFASESADTASATVAVKQGEVVDASRIVNGTYYVKIMAKASSLLYKDSAWSTGGASFTVENEGGPSYDLDMDVAGNPDDGVWGGWHDGGVTINSAEYKNGSVVIDFASNSCTLAYGLQVKYFYPEFEDGMVYSFDVTATANMTVQVTRNNIAYNLVANETKHIVGGALKEFYLQVNQASGLAGKITISNVKWETVVVTTLNAPSFTLDSDKIISITANNTDGVGSYVLGFFVGEATSPSATIEDVRDGMTLDTSIVPNGTYTLKLMAKAVDARYNDSAWSTDTANLTVENEKTTINYGAEGDLTAGWCYWTGGPTVSECYLDAENSVHLTYSGSGDWYGMQLFYKDASTTGVAHDLVLTINSSVAGDITVNGVVCPLVVGDNPISVGGYSGSSISIQFGKNGGGMIGGGKFILKNIEITVA